VPFPWRALSERVSQLDRGGHSGGAQAVSQSATPTSTAMILIDIVVPPTTAKVVHEGSP
jgi:hypothetical protein